MKKNVNLLLEKTAKGYSLMKVEFQSGFSVYVKLCSSKALQNKETYRKVMYRIEKELEEVK